jgi:hypothetical protein
MSVFENFNEKLMSNFAATIHQSWFDRTPGAIGKFSGHENQALRKLADRYDGDSDSIADPDATVTLTAGFSSPFANVSLEPRQVMRYRSFFDIKKLITDAQTGLAESDPQTFKVFLLASSLLARRSRFTLVSLLEVMLRCYALDPNSFVM